MHHVDFILGPYELVNPRMHVKFVTLRAISTLGGQIYVLDALSPTKIDWIDMDFGGLDESSMGLSESGYGSPNLFCF